MKESLKHIVTKNDFTAKALTNRLIAYAIQNVVFDLHSIKSKSEIISALKQSLQIKSSAYEGMIESGFSYAVENSLIKERESGFDLSTSQKKHINNKRLERDNRIQEVISEFFNDCDASCDNIREWLIDSLKIFFKTYSNEWISDITHKTTAISKVKSSLFDLIRNRTQNSTRFNLSKEDKQILPQKFIEFVNTNSPTVNSLISDYGLLAFSSSLISAATSIDSITIGAFSDCTFILDTNILFNLNLEGGTYYSYLPAIKSAFQVLNIKPVVLKCTIDEYLGVLDSHRNEINKTLSNFPHRIGLLGTMVDNAIVQTGLRRGCTSIEDFNTLITEISKTIDVDNDSVEDTKNSQNKSSEGNEELNIEILKINTDLQKIENEIESNKDTQSEYQNFFTEFTSHPKKTSPLEHDVKLIKIAKALREEDKIFILTDDTVLHRYTLEKIPKKDGQPLAIRIITFISLLELQENEEWQSNNGFDEIFSMLLRKELFPSNKILSFEDLDFMFEHNQAIANLSEEDIIRINNEYKKRRLNEDDSDAQVFLSREISKANRIYYEELTKVNVELSTTKNELQKHSNKADVATTALKTRLEKDIITDYKKKRNRVLFWDLVVPILLCIILNTILCYLYLHEQIKCQLFITSLIISVLACAFWDVIKFYSKFREVINKKESYICSELKERLEDALQNN